jgi:hypothetical protein
LEQKQKHRSKLLGWLSAGCALALICAGVSPRQGWAQAPAATNTSDAKPKPKSTSKTQAKAASQPKAASTRTGKSKHNGSRRKKTARGQQKIDSERAQAIQEALIREHYLSGTTAGTWNQASEDAMRRYQADHGWQSKTVPDSRALISLGLGPSHDHLLNPESAMTTGPSATRAASLTPASHSAEPGPRVSTPPSASAGQDGAGPQ